MEEYKAKDKARNDCNILSILRFIKGITRKSLISIAIPSYEHVEVAKSELISRLKLEKSKYESALTFAELKAEDDEEESVANCRYKCKVYKECKEFLDGFQWQNEDKDILGLIFYYGYINSDHEMSPDGKHSIGPSATLKDGKKLFHIFPCPKGFVGDVTMTLGNRFNLDLLNANPWFVEEFGQFK